ncbi:MAG TPA: peptide ABC transporter substrate-binding protein, partial [Candidatus Treponema faecavium]|nr:peptide ABC transporter substrate-binding protein [Candidatus Treponema faecavium]
DYADPMAFLELFRGHSTLNESAWENSEYDSLLEQAAAASSSQTRLELLSQAEQLLLDEAMVIPVSHPVSLNFVSLSELGGWYTNALDIHPFKYLYFKKTNIELPNLVYARQ